MKVLREREDGWKLVEEALPAAGTQCRWIPPQEWIEEACANEIAASKRPAPGPIIAENREERWRIIYLAGDATPFLIQRLHSGEYAPVEFWCDAMSVGGAEHALDLHMRGPAKAIAQWQQQRRRERFGDFEREGELTFIRFGQLPEGGRSRDYRDGRLEAGVAAYRAWRMPDGRYLIDLRGVDAASFLFIRDARPVLELAGELAGQPTSDGTPALRNARIIREIEPEAVEIVQ